MVLTNVYELGNYGIAPWGTGWGNSVGFNDSTAKWIWYTYKANDSAPDNTQTPVKIQYTYSNNTGITISATLKYITDNYSNVKLNNIVLINNDVEGGQSQISLTPGDNLLEFNVWNVGGGPNPAGLVVSVTNTNNAILFNSNYNWLCEKDSPTILIADPPTNLTATRGINGASLTWVVPAYTGVTAINNYLIQYSSDNGVTWLPFNRATSTATTATVTGLTNGTSYIFKVAAVNAVDTGTYSTFSTPIILGTNPDAPTIISVARGNSLVNLSWSAPTDIGGIDITDYSIIYSIDSGNTWSYNILTGSTSTSYTFTGLTNGTTYLFKVAAVNDVDIGSYSSTSSSVTPATIPDPPTNIVGSIGFRNISLTWTVPINTGGSNINDYIVQYSSNNGASWTTFPDTVTSNTFTTVIGIPSGISYVYRVAAVNAVGTSAYSEQSERYVISLSTGGDPIIKPLFGCKFALAKHIEFVNLLADYNNKIFINAEVKILQLNDFPKNIFYDTSFSPTASLSHIYSNSYYRKFYINYQNEKIIIDMDTLGILSKTTNTNPKIKILKFKPQTGLKSISFDKTYPLLESTKGIKIGFGPYLLTLITDLNTDDRHHIDLLITKPQDIINCSGAFISKDQIIKISNIEGSELYQYDSNPFASVKITN